MVNISNTEILCLLILIGGGIFLNYQYNSQTQNYEHDISQVKSYVLSNINSTTSVVDKQNIIMYGCKRYMTITHSEIYYENRCIQDVSDLVMGGS